MSQQQIDGFGSRLLHRERIVTRPDGLRIAVREFGAVSSPRRTFLLMHGFPDNQHLYDELAPLLAKDNRVITFDFVGWGKSDRPRRHIYDTASLRTDLNAVVAALEPSARIDLVVHDLSGQPGIDWAMDHPDRIGTLVLLNTYYHNMPDLVAPEEITRFSTPGAWRSLSIAASNTVPGVWRSGVYRQISKFFSNTAARDLYAPYFAADARRIRPAFFGETRVLRQEITARDQRVERLRAYPGRVLIVFGKDDPYLNPAVAMDFARIFPNHALRLIPKAAHYVQLDQPEAVAEALLTDHQAP